MSWSVVAGVNDVGSGAASATSRSKLLGGAVAVADLIVGVYQRAATTNDLNTDVVTDDLGNTYTIVDTGRDATNSEGVAWFYGFVTVAGTPTITVTFLATHAFTLLEAQAVRSTLGRPVLDAHAGDAGATSYGTGTDAALAPSITPSVDGCIVFGLFNNTGTNNDLSAGTGWTLDQFVHSNNQGPSLIEHEILAVHAATQPTATVATSASLMVNASASFSEALAGGQVFLPQGPRIRFS